MCYYIYFMVVLCFMGIWLNFYHFIKILILVEFMALFIMLMMIFVSFMDHYILFYLILSVCEGVICLLLLILCFRVWGYDSYELIDFDI